jgi:TRAP-type C4-dicarboxylate transport system permease small subunit
MLRTGDPQNASGHAVQGAGSGGLIERGCRLLAALAILIMLLVIGEDVLSRAVWRRSLEISDELGGYLLVAAAFLGLAACKAQGAFQKTDFVSSYLPRKARTASRVAFDLLALGIALILCWQYSRYAIAIWKSGSVAPTWLRTPLWLPAAPMVIGVAAYAWAIVRSIQRTLSGGDLPAAGNERWDSE